MNVRVAFQGGGAKLVLLLAAAEALQSLEARGKIRITRLSGTSAGAIVASLLAAERKISDARTSLLQKSGEMIASYAMPLVPFIPAFRGKPFWSDHLLKDWLTQQLEPFRHRHQIENLTFADFPKHKRPELSVVWTNLSTGSPYLATAGHNVVEAVLSSAGLPFCFRTWKTNNQEVIVDGGMCKNLPISPLMQGLASDDEIIAFSFNRPLPGPITSAKDFAFALLDAAITESVETAQEFLPKDALFRLDATAENISTFDFPKAMEFLGSNRYREVVNEIVSRVETLAARRKQQIRNIKSDLWKNPEVSKMMRSLGKFYDESFVHHRFRYALMRVQITAYSLVSSGEAGHGRLDEIKYTFVFEAIDHPITIHRLFLSAPLTVDHIPEYETHVSLANGKKIDVEFVGACVANKPNLRALLALFSPPLQKDDGACRLTLTDYAPDTVGGLGRGARTDLLRLEVSRANGAIGSIEIGLFVPTGFNKISLKRHNLIKPNEMSEYEKINAFDLPPAGFSCQAWKAQDVPSGADIEVEFLSD